MFQNIFFSKFKYNFPFKLVQNLNHAFFIVCRDTANGIVVRRLTLKSFGDGIEDKEEDMEPLILVKPSAQLKKYL